MLRCEERFLPFNNLEEALKYVEEELLSFIKDTSSFFEKEIHEPEKEVRKIIFELDKALKRLNYRNNFSLGLERSRDLIFETLKKMESVKIHQKNQLIRSEVVEMRNKLILLFIQGDRLVKMREVNESALKNISEYLRFCQKYLTSFLSKEKEIDSYSAKQIQEKLVFCSYELKQAYHIEPYETKFKNISTQVLSRNPEKILKEESSEKIQKRIENAISFI